MKSASQLSPSALHATQNVKAIGLFRVQENPTFSVLLVTVNAEGVPPLEAIITACLTETGWRTESVCAQSFFF